MESMSNHPIPCFDTECTMGAKRRFTTRFEDSTSEVLDACNMHARQIIAVARRNPLMDYDVMESLV